MFSLLVALGVTLGGCGKTEVCNPHFPTGPSGCTGSSGSNGTTTASVMLYSNSTYDGAIHVSINNSDSSVLSANMWISNSQIAADGPNGPSCGDPNGWTTDGYAVGSTISFYAYDQTGYWAGTLYAYSGCNTELLDQGIYANKMAPVGNDTVGVTAPVTIPAKVQGFQRHKRTSESDAYFIPLIKTRTLTAKKISTYFQTHSTE